MPPERPLQPGLRDEKSSAPCCRGEALLRGTTLLQRSNLRPQAPCIGSTRQDFIARDAFSCALGRPERPAAGSAPFSRGRALCLSACNRFLLQRAAFIIPIFFRTRKPHSARIRRKNTQNHRSAKRGGRTAPRRFGRRPGVPLRKAPIQGMAARSSSDPMRTKARRRADGEAGDGHVGHREAAHSRRALPRAWASAPNPARDFFIFASRRFTGFGSGS